MLSLRGLMDHMMSFISLIMIGGGLSLKVGRGFLGACISVHKQPTTALKFFLFLCRKFIHNLTITSMATSQKNNPLHGKTLEDILLYLVARYGWEELGVRIRINCFNDNPGIQSSLKFLRKTGWARKKVEDLYIGSQDDK